MKSLGFNGGASFSSKPFSHHLTIFRQSLVVKWIKKINDNYFDISCWSTINRLLLRNWPSLCSRFIVNIEKKIVSNHSLHARTTTTTLFCVPSIQQKPNKNERFEKFHHHFYLIYQLITRSNNFIFIANSICFCILYERKNISC